MKTSVILTIAAVGLVAACSAKQKSKSAELLPGTNGLRSVADFASIADEKERSAALFSEMTAVIQHPRCSNCHPAGDRPLQGDEPVPHLPLVVRGEDGRGAPGMQCSTCHGEQSYENVPGAPDWHLAPIEMAWTGKSKREICEQLKDPERNGGKSLEEIAVHMAEDKLVSYGWSPPKQLSPAPGSQALLGQLAFAWVETGAACPE